VKLKGGYITNFAASPAIDEPNAMLDMKTDFGCYTYKEMRHLMNSSKYY